MSVPGRFKQLHPIKKISLALIGCLILVVLFCGGAWVGAKLLVQSYQYFNSLVTGEQQALEEAGKRLGITPTRESVADYFLRDIKLGMSKPDVYRRAYKVLPFSVAPIGFDEPQPCHEPGEYLHVEYLILHLGRSSGILFYTCYDLSGKLVYIRKELEGSP